ncbi:MAG: UbiA family prenyltransferase, partial [bacterium]
VVFSNSFRSMKPIQIFVFGNIYISLCAVVMVLYTTQLFNLNISTNIFLFIFFATLNSYSFHWFLTPDIHSDSERYIWVNNNKTLLLILFIISSICSLIFIYFLRKYILILLIAAAVTFFYSASKIPFKPFTYLKKIIVGKTIYLAVVWTFVTAILPVLLSEKIWEDQNTFFFINRFFLIYPVCLLFDYRDKDEDKKQNIKNIVGLISLKALRLFYYICLLIFFISSVVLIYYDFSLIQFIIIVLPGIFLLFSFGYSINTKSDYWYYMYLDGLMMLSGIVNAIIKFKYKS